MKTLLKLAFLILYLCHLVSARWRAGMMNVIYSSDHVIRVRRSFLIKDAKKRLLDWYPWVFWSKRVKVKYIGELGRDYGGLKNDFVDQVAKYLFNPRNGLFEMRDDQTFYPKSDPESDGICLEKIRDSCAKFFSRNDDTWEFVGKFFGFVFAQRQSLGYDVNVLLYQYLLTPGPFNISHLKLFDRQAYIGLKNLLDHDQEDYGLTFVDMNGNPLSKNISSKTKVTNQNKKIFAK